MQKNVSETTKSTLRGKCLLRRELIRQEDEEARGLSG